jgi:hypothetical protein
MDHRSGQILTSSSCLWCVNDTEPLTDPPVSEVAGIPDFNFKERNIKTKAPYKT